MSTNPMDDAVALLVGMSSVSVQMARLALERSAGDVNRAAIECLDNGLGLQAELDRRQSLERRRARIETIHVHDDDGEDYDEGFESTFLLNKLKPLPIPADDVLRDLRNRRYNVPRDLRRTLFARRTHDSYFECRQLYAEAYQLIGFAALHSLDDIIASCPDYSADLQIADGKKCIIVLRKVGECCYYLNRLAEAIFACKKAIEVCKKFRLDHIGWFAWGVLCKVHTERRDFERATHAIEMAETLKQGSGYLYKAKVNLTRAQKGIEELGDGPSELRKKCPNAKWYEGDELAMEKCRRLELDVCERYKFGLSLLESQKFPWLFIAWIHVGERKLSCCWTSLLLY